MVTAISLGLPVSACYALNELKANMLAQSCRADGYSTLLINLMLTDKRTSEIAMDPEKLVTYARWQQNYIRCVPMTFIM